MWTLSIHQNGAMKYVYSESNDAEWCRSEATPESAMLRA